MKRVLAFCFIGAVGALIFLAFYPLAFPEASINFRIRPSEALERGRQAIQQLGGPDLSKGYISTVDFQWDEKVKRYLEKMMGLEKANEVMEREIFLWHYYCIWQRPGDRHLYRAGITPDGRVLWAEIVLPEEAEGAFLSEREARKVAEVFLSKEQVKVNLSDWRFVSAIHAKRPNRSDYTFIYEHRHKKFPANQNDGATLRLWVDISGDKVTGYCLNYLHLPERWKFEEGRKQTQRIVLSVIFSVAYALLTLALIGWFIVCVARKELLLWRLGLIVGGIIAILTFLTGLNFATLWWFSYDPSKPVSVFLTREFVFLLLETLIQLLFYSVIVLVGEQLSREQTPMGIPLSVMLRPKFWTTKEAIVALTIGICFGLAQLGYVTAFYLLSRKVGVWTPLEIPYTNAVVTPLPFLVPLHIGLSPALTEELFFRLATPYLLWRWTKRWWLSMLLPGIIWAFSHVGYPPEPAFIRGLELTVVALGYAWIMQRYGFTAPIIAHFTYNAVLESQLLLRSDEPFFRFSGIVPFASFLLLFLPAAIVYLKHHRLPSAYEVPPFTLMPIPKEPSIQPVPYASYQPISRKNWLALIALCTIGAVTPFFSREHENFKPVALMEINRWEAQRIASDYLKQRGVPVERYRVASDLRSYVDNDFEENAYLLEYAGKEALYRFWKNEKPPVFWVVRFFRPYDREVWRVILDPKGQVWNFSHSLPEEAKGAVLTQKHALEIAENYLRKEKGINLSEWKLVETDHENLPNRRDWALTYEHKTRKVNDATLRLRVKVQGDQAQGFGIWWEVPEEWGFEREQFKAWGDLVFVYLLVLALLSVIYMGICDWMERALGMNWRLALKMMLPLACLIGLQTLNATASMWVSYPTNLPPTAWLLMFFLISGISAIFVVFAVSALIGSFEPNWMSKRLPEMVPLSVWLSRHRENPDLMETPVNHPAAIKDAIAFGYLASFALWSLFEETELNASLLRSSWLPVLDYLAWTVWAVIILILFGIGFAGIYRRYIRTLDRLFILLLVLLPTGLLGVDSPEKFVSEFTKWSVGLFAMAGILYWLGRFVLRHNLYAWALGIALSMLLAVSVQLLQAPDIFWKAQAVPLLALYALPALLWVKQKSSLTYPTFRLTQK